MRERGIYELSIVSLHYRREKRYLGAIIIIFIIKNLVDILTNSKVEFVSIYSVVIIYYIIRD